MDCEITAKTLPADLDTACWECSECEAFVTTASFTWLAVWDSWQPGSCLPLGVLFDTGSRGTVRWSVHDVGFVATADSYEISNSVPAARSFAGDTHSADQSAACARDHSCRMAVACEQAENPARGSCDAKKQRVYRRCKRSVTGMSGVNQRIKRNCEGQCEGESAPSSLALSMAAST